MDELIQPEPSATAVPAADVTVPSAVTGPVIQQAFPLRQPEEEANEILVRVRGSVLRRIRARLQTLRREGKVPWAELLLGGATLALGGTLGALASSLPWAAIEHGAAEPTPKSLAFYVVLPVIGVGCLTAYLFLRRLGTERASTVAGAVLDELPDPDKAL